MVSKYRTYYYIFFVYFCVSLCYKTLEKYNNDLERDTFQNCTYDLCAHNHRQNYQNGEKKEFGDSMVAFFS